VKASTMVVLAVLSGSMVAAARGGPEDATPAPEKTKADTPIMIGGHFPVEVVADIPYVDGADADKKQKLDLYLPKGQRNVPVLLFIHGGAWRSGDRMLYGPLGRTFARNGVATVIISYRLTPQVKHPGHIEDVARAFAWTVKNIAKYGGNPAQIFVSGQSAGGHLAALLATNDQFLAAEKLSAKAIKGVVPISGIYLTGEHKVFDGVIGKDKESALSASPLRHVTGDEPPFLIMYADNDFKTCDAMSKAFAKALQAKKVPARVVEIPDRNHITIIVRMAASAADPVSQETLKFIAEHGHLTLTPKKDSDKTEEAAGKAAPTNIKSN
jgi:acetyl esterase/lipase